MSFELGLMLIIAYVLAVMGTSLAVEEPVREKQMDALNKVVGGVFLSVSLVLILTAIIVTNPAP